MRIFLTESRRFEKRAALVDALAQEAGFEVIVPEPTPPRTTIDVDGAPSRGDAAAEVTVVAFVDFTQPASAEASAEIRRLMTEHPGKIRQVHRNSLAQANETSLRAALLALAAQEKVTDLDAVASRVHPLTFVVVATHGHYDEPALERALGAGARYVGLVASKKRAAPIVEHLGRQGVSAERLAALKAPAGLDLGARRGDEIALSIMAEVVQLRRQIESVEWPRDEAPAEVGSCCGSKKAEPETAVDPICGMTVQVEGALHTYEHEGTVYYFCCGGCRTKFAAEVGQA